MMRCHLRIATILLASCMVAALADAAPPEELVTLTIRERADIARQDEYVTIGVPLPEGRVKSHHRLAVLKDGESVGAEIIPVTRWWDDGSLRWVHLIFPADCAAGGTETVTLALLDEPVSRTGPTIVSGDSDFSFKVDTGPLQLWADRMAFNLFDRVVVDGNEILEPHPCGIGVKVAGEEYWAKFGPKPTAYIEEYGKRRIVIRYAGSFGNKAFEKMLDYDCRIYAYAGSRSVRVSLTIINRQGAIDIPVPLEAFLVEIPMTFKPTHSVFGTEDGPATAPLPAGDEAWVYQSSSDRHTFGGVLSGEGGGKTRKSARFGWGGIANDQTGVAIGVRWFWQMNPKSIEVRGDGRVVVGLYPERHEKPLDLYPGVARTHELMFVFGKQDPAALESAFAGLQQPLRPFAPPRWYCRDTRALGDFCEAGGEDLYGPFTEVVKRFDDAFAEANRRCEQFRDRRVLKGVETDSYGFLGYGDGVHYVWTPNVDVPENIARDGNYYGYPHMMCVQFMRTGDVGYFDNFEAHALHVADVHTVHYAGERENLVGGCRYCPPTDHVRIDPTDWSDYRTARVYVSDLFNHHKVAGVIDRWYLLGDHRCRDVARMVLDYCHRHTYGDNDYGQPRGPGMTMVFCADAYDLLGDREKWAKRASNVLRVHRNRDLRLSFQAGIFLEGLRRYYEFSGDEEALDYLKKSCDRIVETNGKQGGNTCAAMSYMYRKTVEQKYLDLALEKLPQSGQFGNPWKEFGLSMRNAALCIGDLHRIAEDGDRLVNSPNLSPNAE